MSSTVPILIISSFFGSKVQIWEVRYEKDAIMRLLSAKASGTGLVYSVPVSIKHDDGGGDSGDKPVVY